VDTRSDVARGCAAASVELTVPAVGPQVFVKAIAEARHFVATGLLPAGMTSAFVPGVDAPVLAPPKARPKKAAERKAPESAAAAAAAAAAAGHAEEPDNGKRKRKRPARVADSGWPAPPGGTVRRRVQVGRHLGLLPPSADF
jgi:hypothetical protein